MNVETIDYKDNNALDAGPNFEDNIIVHLSNICAPFEKVLFLWGNFLDDESSRFRLRSENARNVLEFNFPGTRGSGELVVEQQVCEYNLGLHASKSFSCKQISISEFLIVCIVYIIIHDSLFGVLLVIMPKI